MNLYWCVLAAIAIGGRMSLSFGGWDVIQESEGETGPAGPKGEKGDRGRYGLPGLRGLPGESCHCSFEEDLQGQIDELKEQMEEMKNPHHTTTASPSSPRDCRNVTSQGHSSGVYTIHPTSAGDEGMRVYCDTETDGGGWIVFQRREDGSVDFWRGWDEYKDGFGNLSGEFWLGLENIHTLMLEGDYELRIDLADFENETRFAKYSSFSVAAEDHNFMGTFSGYSGDVGDAMIEVQDIPFTTIGRDNDEAHANCADMFTGAWWYIACHKANLNGRYLEGKHDSYGKGVEWEPWHGQFYSLKFTEMKMKRVE